MTELSDLALYDPSSLPPEVAVDQYHPMGDEFMRHLLGLQRAITTVSARLKPRQVAAAKLFHKGKTKVAIAEELGVHQMTIGKWFKLPDMHQLLTLLQHYAATLDGPREEQRRHLLWRVAVDNRDSDPRTAIAAVAEINRMDMNTHTRATGAGGPTTVNVVINQDQLPRTSLDG